MKDAVRPDPAREPARHERRRILGVDQGGADQDVAFAEIRDVEDGHVADAGLGIDVGRLDVQAGTGIQRLSTPASPSAAIAVRASTAVPGRGAEMVTARWTVSAGASLTA